MSVVALLPLLVLVAGVAVGLAGARCADEAVQLLAELRRVGQVRPLLAEIGDENRRLRAAMARRRP